MRNLPSMALLAALATLAGCSDRTTPAASPESPAAPAAAPVEATASTTTPTATPAPIEGSAGGSLHVDAPAKGTISFQGFGPARFGGTEEDVRMAWGGDLGDAKPSEPGGCHYLIPQPVGTDGYRTAFMIEGDRFVRIDVQRADVTAPGGGKVGMTKAQVAALYPGLTEQPHKYSDGLYLRILDTAGGRGVLLFETDGQDEGAKVTEWRIGVPPQVDYVEGCS